MVALIRGMVIVAILCFVIYFFCSRVFKRVWKANKVWGGPYECGFSASSLRFNYFRFMYFSLLVFFVVFDLEISLLLNMPEQGKLFNKFVYYNMFLFILAFRFIVEVLVGYVRWGY